MRKSMDIYERLGLKKIINASDTYTVIGGSCMALEVLQAMCEAADSFVDVIELQTKVGERIAELTGNEAAFVTTGAAAGIILSAAACMTLDRDDLIGRIPDTSGFPRNEFIVFESQCLDINPYWRLIGHAGGKIVKAGSSLDAVRKAVCEKTAGLFYFAGTLYETETPEPGDVVALAHACGIPVVVDAAAQLPPAENLWYYTRTLEADLALFSGGKYIMGPQSTGIILGKRQLVDACRKNGFPNMAIGRPMKTGKEELAALLTAVELLLQSDPKVTAARYHRLLDKIWSVISAEPGIEVFKTDRGRLGQTIPLLMIRLPDGRSSTECHRYLRSCDPAVDIGYFHNGDQGMVFINPINLRDGEEDIVAQCLLQYFRKA